nr:VOC family protein [Shimia sagamensis]
MGTRSLDHAVFAVDDLETAHSTFERLGFSVAPRGVHPFGTHNANIYFRNGLMIELLAVDDPSLYRLSANEQNTFTKNDAEFRAFVWQQGISQIVVNTTDASADHQAFLDAGISGGSVVAFSRDFTHPDNRTEKISAKLAFATPKNSKGAYWSSCEDKEAPNSIASEILDHSNGALHLVEVVTVASDPADLTSFLETVYRVQAGRSLPGSLAVLLSNARHTVMQPHVVVERFGVHVSPLETVCRHVGLVFEVADIAATVCCLKNSGIEVQDHQSQAIVFPFSCSHPFLVFKQHHARSAPQLCQHNPAAHAGPETKAPRSAGH